MAVPMRLQCKSVLWRTPQPILQIVRSMFGGSIAYDPCADSGNWTQADVFRTSGGLDDEWGDRTFVNPPYNDDNLVPWARKCYEQAQRGSGSSSCVLPTGWVTTTTRTTCSDRPT